MYLTSGSNWALNGTDSIRSSTFSSLTNPFAYELLLIIFVSIVFHSISLLLLPWHFNFLVLLSTITNIQTTYSNGKNIIDILISNLNKIILYLIFVYTVSFIIGKLSHILVRTFKLDIKFKLFRFPYYWYYLLSGESLAFPENGSEEIPDGTYIAATVEQNGCTYIYYGVLHDYVIDEKGDLKTLFIKKAFRRNLTADANSNNKNESRFYPIRGTYLALSYIDIKSLNIEYYYLEPQVA